MARARAWLVDFMLRALVLMSLPAVLMPFGDVGAGLYFLLLFAVTLLYPIFFEALWNGATPGKRVCNLAVVHADGTPVGWPAAFLRNVVRIADALPLGYAVGLASMLLDRQFRRLGDLAAGTVVIHRDAIAKPSKAARAEGEAAPIAPAVRLTPLEQRAILDFAERRRGWSDERAAELAETAAPLLEGDAGPAAVGRLEGIAAHLRARR